MFLFQATIDSLNIIKRMKHSFLHELILMGEASSECCLALLEAAVVCKRKPKHDGMEKNTGVVTEIIVSFNTSYTNIAHFLDARDQLSNATVKI